MTVALAAAVVGAPGARAGEAACRTDQGALVVTAKADGLIGEFILDTGLARTVIDATQASEAGLAAPTRIPVRFAGATHWVVADVAPLDARTRNFATPITGVLGSDVLSGRVVDIDAWPCRVVIRAHGRAGGGNAGRLRVTLDGGVPVVSGAVSDGARAEPARFRIDTGSPLSVMFNATAAQTQPLGAAGRGSLRALSLGPFLEQDLDAGVASGPSKPDFASLGWPLLARYRLSLDYRRGLLTLTPRRVGLPPGFAAGVSSAKLGGGAQPDE